MSLDLLPIIIFGALIDSINPCVFGVLILLITVLTRAKKSDTIIKHGLVYIAGVYFTYLLAGLTLLAVFNAMQAFRLVASLFYVAIGLAVMAAGFLEVKDYFWYGRWYSLSIPVRFVKWIESKVQSTHVSLPAAFMFGVGVTLIELPCTGAPYLAVLTLFSLRPFLEVLPLLLLYNLIFVAPLFAIIYLAYKGATVRSLERWRREHKGLMRLIVGLFLLFLGVFIMWFVYSEYVVPLTAFIVAVLAGMAIASKFERTGRNFNKG